MQDLLSWRRNGGSLRVAVMAHRAAALGHDVRRTPDGYLVPRRIAPAAKALGLDLQTSPGGAGVRLRPPKIALYAGAAIGYPYYAYYAHCLLSLGLPYTHLDAAGVACGGLDRVDLLVIPGGFANWGLDRAEEQIGVDAAIGQFIARNGAIIGSCGGAYYLSEGRPGWHGVIDAKPKYTHEYLQTGAAVVNVHITDVALRAGLSDRIEVLYYHGPVYPTDARQAETLATFEDLSLPSQLLINNPLQRETFENEMRGRPAILMAEPSRGRAIVVSAHPEMGEFIRKAVALDGYVRKYLPIRGEKVMDETLRFYSTEDCASFRLLLNAMAKLDVFSGDEIVLKAARPDSIRQLSDSLRSFQAARQDARMRQIGARLNEEDPALAKLLTAEMARLLRQYDGYSDGLEQCLTAVEPGLDEDLCAGLAPLLNDSMKNLPTIASRPLVEAMALMELPVRILAAAARLIQTDSALKVTAHAV